MYAIRCRITTNGGRENVARRKCAVMVMALSHCRRPYGWLPGYLRLVSQ